MWRGHWRGAGSNGGQPSSAPIGATALALTAELLFHARSADGRFEPIREAWLRGLLAMKKPNGTFRQSPESSDSSPYYDGETWLALAWYDVVDPAHDFGDLLKEIDNSMIDRYGRQPNVGFYHWGIVAAKKRFDATGDARFFDFAIDQTREYLEKLRPDPDIDRNSCYALEGLVTTLGFATAEPASDGRVEAVEQRVDMIVPAMLRMQLQPTDASLALGPGTILVSPHLRSHEGAFLAGRYRPWTRIDYTQHCLSGVGQAHRAAQGSS
jgi:hypothetical protein